MRIRFRNIRTVASAAVLAASLVSGLAEAAPVQFTVTGAAGNGGFYINDTEIPQNFGPYDRYTMLNTTGIFSGLNQVDFFSSDLFNGGFNAFSGDVTGGPGVFGGTVVFSGNLGTEQFLPGTFSLTNSPWTVPETYSATLKIGPTAPAPLAGGGLLAAVAALAGLALTRLRKPTLAAI